MKNKITALLFLTSFVLFSQQTKIDSLEKAFLKEKNTSKRVYNLLAFMGKAYNADYKKFSTYLDTLTIIKETLKTDSINAYYHKFLCGDYLRRGNYQEAINEANKASTIFKKIGNLKDNLSTKNLLAILYKRTDKKDSAKYVYNSILELTKNANDKKLRRINGNAQYGLSLMYSDELKYDEAIKAMNVAISKFKENNDNDGVGDCFYILATYYKRLNNYTKAKELFYEALELIDATKYSYRGAIMNNLANMIKSEDSLLIKKSYYNQALYYMKKNQNIRVYPTKN